MKWMVSAGLVAMLVTPQAFPASVFKKALSTKTDDYVGQGVFTGGQAGPGFTLLNVRRQNSVESRA